MSLPSPHTNVELTPGAERALVAAAAWSSPEDAPPLLPLLLGLLAEENAAAALLGEQDVTIDLIRATWPKVKMAPHREEPTQPFDAASALRGLTLALGRLAAVAEIGTEHLLLGAAAIDENLADFLGQRRVTLAAMQERWNLGEVDTQRLEDSIDEVPLEWPEEVAAPHSEEEPHEATKDRTLVRFVDHPAEDFSTAIQPRVTRVAGEVLRIIDAAANRAAEGMRTVEDYVRFARDDYILTQAWKELRHELTHCLQSIDVESRIKSRDVIGDVGTNTKTEPESQREDAAAVVRGAIQRVKQSLRSLEEYSKVENPETARGLERLRYRSYALESATESALSVDDRLADARLYVLLPPQRSAPKFNDLASLLYESGVDVLQLRAKGIADGELFTLAESLQQAARVAGKIALINDRADVAAAVGARGVHVGQDDLSVAACRRIVGDQIVGVSTHNIDQLQQAVLDGADYVGLGPTFPSQTKAFDAFAGVKFLREAAAAASLPCFALGGITLENLDQVLEAGVERVAVSGAILNASDPAAAAREFAARLRTI